MTNRKSCIIFAVENRKQVKNSKDMATINLTKGGFERIVAELNSIENNWNFLGDKPALIDFYAAWCGPCKALAPILEELSEEYAGKVDIYKVNVDTEEELAAAFGIRSIPTLYFIPMKGQPQRAMGAMPKEQLRKMLDNIIK